MDPTMLNPPRTTLWHWLSLLTWALMLAAILFLLLIGPGRHKAFDNFSVAVVFSVGGVMIIGTCCICCYMGYDGFHVICFGPDLEAEELKRRDLLFRQKLRRTLQKKKDQDIERLQRKIGSEDFSETMKSLDSKVYRKFSDTPDNGPFTVQINPDGTTSIVAQQPLAIDTFSYEKDLGPDKKRQRIQNWLDDDDDDDTENTRRLVDPLETQYDRSPTNVGQRIQNAQIPSSRGFAREVHPLALRSFSESFSSSIPEAFEYQTPERRMSINSTLLKFK